MSVTSAITEMVDRIVREFQPEKIILFGSRARGDTHKWSDVDLLVVMPDGTDRQGTRIAIRRALNDVLVSKDIIVTTLDEITRRSHIVGTVLRPALIEGRVLYERTSNDYA